MNYWRGYLVAAIIFLCTWALGQFCAAHTQLVDMVYPYITRIIMDYLAGWSADFAGCLWQTLLVIGAVGILACVVLTIVLRWNPIQVTGWVLAAVSVISLLNTGMYGLNEHAGPLAEDIRLQTSDYSVGTLEQAAIYYRDMANEYAVKVARNGDNSVKYPAFEELAQQAGESFTTLTYEYTYPVFSGDTTPVKQLGFTNFYEGVTGVTVGLTGESAVNPNVPAIGQPIAICKEMSRRMCIYDESDAEFAAFLACSVNSSDEFRYAAYLMAYRHCYNALAAINSELGRDALSRVTAEVSGFVARDMQTYGAFFGEQKDAVNEDVCKLLVSWYLQEIVDPAEEDQQEDLFDPMDESDPRVDAIINPTEPEEED